MYTIMYTNNVTYVLWSSIASRSFSVKNGVRQGGIISPILICVYLDGLLLQLRNSALVATLQNSLLVH